MCEGCMCEGCVWSVWCTCGCGGCVEGCVVEVVWSVVECEEICMDGVCVEVCVEGVQCMGMCTWRMCVCVMRGKCVYMCVHRSSEVPGY